MTVTDAYKKLMDENPDIEVTSCFEYANYFAFNTKPKGSKDGVYLDSTLGVEKKSGRIMVFSPLTVDAKELKNPKPISFTTKDGRHVESKLGIGLLDSVKSK